MGKWLSGRAPAFWLTTALIVALAVRFALWHLYAPVEYSDSRSYRRLADGILAGWVYDGTRTPGYPLFMAWLGSDERIWLAQMGLGVAITALMFYLGYQVTGRAWFGGVMALAHTLNLGQLFFEAAILTETLTTFWLMLALAGAALWLYHPRWRSPWLATLLGLVATLAAITRPLFLYLPFWILLFLWLGNERWTRKLLFSLALLLPTAAILGSWVNFIHQTYGDWALTTMTGYHLMQHTGEFFELAPDRYAALRDTYLQYRAARMALTGTQTNTIWEAIPAMQQASGMTFFDLNRTLARISLQLIRQHPDLYLRNVLQGWWMFWRAPVYWSPEALHWPGLVGMMQTAIFVERGCLLAVNLAFIFASIHSLAKRRICNLPMYGLLIGAIWLCSIFQTLLDHGDNPRFLVPLQSAVVLWLGWWVVIWLSDRRRHPSVQ